MLIIRKNQTNNLIATVSMNKTLANPYYLFSFQHIASKERISFYPQVITSNVRYDKFRFVEAPTTNLSTSPPQVFFEYLGQYYYSIYENITSGSTDISLAYNKLESGRAWVIVGDDNTQECFFEPYISNDEDFAQVIYVSDEEEACIYPTPSITPSNTSTPISSPTPSVSPTNTPSITPSVTPSITPTMTQTPSGTPPMIDPNTLSALWWIDYTDSSYLTLIGGSSIAGATNRTGNPSFSANTGNEPGWFSTGYNGVSGATGTGNRITSLLGDYNTSISAYTTFFSYSAGTFDQATIIQSDFTTDYSGNSQSYRWFSVDDYSGFATFWRTYTFYTNGSSVSPEPFYYYNAGQWYFGATRVYQSGTTGVTEIWVNGTLQSQTLQNSVTIRTSTNPIFQIGGAGGPNFKISEAFFFDYALSDGDMGLMFNYLNNKY